MPEKCDAKTEVWSRVCGFFRPVAQWNRGKREEYKDRKEFTPGGDLQEVNHGDA